ncbi:uncharacterized protein LOC104910094 isoform X3 [Meleagris gallopavo]|uniref:uncharacterized protein LOC104910094 isoform X3 n=1 Tax=Meleagris gallopavo TaxID=9103 RepID=UPI0012AB68B9|nr:uncharacterized protein LOC104910094 isoform X3 [Meleagris gallopavo]
MTSVVFPLSTDAVTHLVLLQDTYHLGILGFLGKGKTRCSSKSVRLIPPGISGSSCRGPSWLPYAHSDGLCEDPYQAVLEKKASSNCHGTGKAVADWLHSAERLPGQTSVLHACLGLAVSVLSGNDCNRKNSSRKDSEVEEETKTSSASSGNAGVSLTCLLDLDFLRLATRVWVGVCLELHSL